MYTVSPLTNLMHKILTVSFLFCVSGCASPMLWTGLGVSSVAVTETTGRGIVDHTASAITQQDCRLPRALHDQPVCQDAALSKIAVTTTGTKPSTVDQIESKYRQ